MLAAQHWYRKFSQPAKFFANPSRFIPKPKCAKASRLQSLQMNPAPHQDVPPFPFHTLVLLREQEIAKQLRDAFQQRYLPEHLFYWLPSSVQAWVDLCRSTEYKNSSRALEALCMAAPELARELSDVRVLCGLGCGEGSKDQVLLKAFSNAGNKPNYIAADFSQALLELAADHVDDVAASVLGCKLDILHDVHLSAVTGAAQIFEGPVLYTVLGNTLGAFDPAKFPARILPHLRPGDGLLFDGEIYGDSTLAGYDNPANRRFAWGPLTGVGITTADGRLEFSTAPAEDGLFIVTKHFIATRGIRANIGGDTIQIRSGEKLRMSSSIKYASEAALLRFVERAGFRVASRWRSSDGQLILACATPI
jgi:uncharacterized SAM-dependent methyltransferase